MKIRDRSTGEIWQEGTESDNMFAFLYTSPAGRVILKSVLARPWFSAVAGKVCDTRFSARFIDNFALKNDIDLSDWAHSPFSSFNDFFARQRPYSTQATPDELIAIADSRLSAYPITPDLRVTIKGSPYTLEELTGNYPDVDAFTGGTCLVFRLAVDNYHRYVHVDDGRMLARVRIPGILHTVRPVDGNEGVYRRNTRIVNVMETKRCGRVIHIDVGATLVARMVDEGKKEFVRLEEKGHFEYGASTVILLLPSHIRIDDDILDASANDIETRVSIGEKIGVIAPLPA